MHFYMRAGILGIGLLGGIIACSAPTENQLTDSIEQANSVSSTLVEESRLLVEIPVGRNVVMIREGLDPYGPPFALTELAPVGVAPVVPSELAARGPVAVWDALRPGEPLPSALVDALKRKSVEPTDPEKERELAYENDVTFKKAYPDDQLSLIEGEDYRWRTQSEVNDFLARVAKPESGMWPNTSSTNHFSGVTTEWNWWTHWAHGKWQRFTHMTQMGWGGGGYTTLEYWTKGAYKLYSRHDVKAGWWFRHHVWAKGQFAAYHFRARAENTEGTGNLLGLAILGSTHWFAQQNQGPQLPPSCKYSNIMTTTRCTNFDGTASSLNQSPITVIGCGSTPEVARQAAVYHMTVGRGVCIGTAAGCCGVSENPVFDACLCR